MRRFALIVLVLLLLAACVLYGLYRWSQTQYYIGNADGYVAVYQGEPDSVLGLSMHHEIKRSTILVTDLGSEGEAVNDNVSVYNSESRALQQLAALKASICKPPPSTKTPKRTNAPTPTARRTAATRRATRRPTTTPTATHTLPTGCSTP